MAAYSQLQGPQQQLQFFKLLVSEFGVQREWREQGARLCVCTFLAQGTQGCMVRDSF